MSEDIFPRADAMPLDEDAQPIRTYVQAVHRETHIERSHEVPGLDDDQHLRLIALNMANKEGLFRDEDVDRKIIERADHFVAYIKDGSVPDAPSVKEATTSA